MCPSLILGMRTRIGWQALVVGDVQRQACGLIDVDRLPARSGAYNLSCIRPCAWGGRIVRKMWENLVWAAAQVDAQPSQAAHLSRACRGVGTTLDGTAMQGTCDMRHVCSD